MKINRLNSVGRIAQHGGKTVKLEWFGLQVSLSNRACTLTASGARCFHGSMEQWLDGYVVFKILARHLRVHCLLCISTFSIGSVLRL